MNKRQIFLFVFLLVILLVAGTIYSSVLKPRMSPTDYSVVYLTNGEMYVGKLVSWPQLELTDAYLLLVIKNSAEPTKNNFQLSPLKDAIWAPQKLFINSKQVLYYGPLAENSKVAQALRESKK